MQQLNWGILSTARIAQTAMIPTLHASSNARLLAIASHSNKADEVARQFDIPKAYGDFQALLEDPEVDAVYVPLPNSLHAEWVIKAAHHGKHVLCEKPAALDLAEASRMLSVCREQGVCFMEGYMYRHHPQHQRVREILDSGEIGELRHVRGQFSFPMVLSTPSIKLDKALGGGSIHDVGCYPLDVIRRLLGMPERVTVVGEVPETLGVDTSASGILSFADGRLAEFTSSFRQTLIQRYEVIGSHGTLQAPLAFRPDKHGGPGHLVVTDAQGNQRVEHVEGNQYPAQINAFSAWALGDETQAPDPQDFRGQASLIDACYRSLHGGGSVTPEAVTD